MHFRYRERNDYIVDVSFPGTKLPSNIRSHELSSPTTVALLGSRPTRYSGSTIMSFLTIVRPRATAVGGAHLGLGCVYIRILLCGLACGLQSTSLVSQWQLRRCPTRLFGNQHCQWPTQGGSLSPARWVASASIRSMVLDRFGRRGISGETPRGGSPPVYLRTHPRWSE